MSEAPSGVVGESTGSPRSDPARTYRTAIAFTPTIKLGGLEVDILHRRVRAGPSELHLTSIDQSLLYLLAANAGRLVTREQILDSLWGATSRRAATWSIAMCAIYEPSFTTIGAGRGSSPPVPGRGYRFLHAPAEEPAIAGSGSTKEPYVLPIEMPWPSSRATADSGATRARRPSARG